MGLHFRAPQLLVGSDRGPPSWDEPPFRGPSKRPLGEIFGPSWGAPGAVSEVSWARHGALLGHPPGGLPLGPSEPPFGALLVPTWGVLGLARKPLQPDLGAFL
eukprot:2599395-Pyramimonas_sp.AAC.1